jgi:hypothetical protein
VRRQRVEGVQERRPGHRPTEIGEGERHRPRPGANRDTSLRQKEEADGVRVGCLEEDDRVGAQRRSRRDMGHSTGLKRKEDNDVGVRRSEEASDIGARWRSGPGPGVGSGGGLR